jgi:hypothetical protein
MIEPAAARNGGDGNPMTCPDGGNPSACGNAGNPMRREQVSEAS